MCIYVDMQCTPQAQKINCSLRHLTAPKHSGCYLCDYWLSTHGTIARNGWDKAFFVSFFLRRKQPCQETRWQDSQVHFQLQYDININRNHCLTFFLCACVCHLFHWQDTWTHRKVYLTGPLKITFHHARKENDNQCRGDSTPGEECLHQTWVGCTAGTIEQTNSRNDYDITTKMSTLCQPSQIIPQAILFRCS